MRYVYSSYDKRWKNHNIINTVENKSASDKTGRRERGVRQRCASSRPPAPASRTALAAGRASMRRSEARGVARATRRFAPARRLCSAINGGTKTWLYI